MRERSIGFNVELVGVAYDAESQGTGADDRHQITTCLLKNVLALCDDLVTSTPRAHVLRCP